jgi:UDP-glucose 4-epimerase
MAIMVTGGAGYIGSHTCVELINHGRSIVIFDNFSNSQLEVLDRIERITGVAPTVVRGDVRDSDHLKSTMLKYQCRDVIHFAGLKSDAMRLGQSCPVAFVWQMAIGIAKFNAKSLVSLLFWPTYSWSH